MFGAVTMDATGSKPLKVVCVPDVHFGSWGAQVTLSSKGGGKEMLDSKRRLTQQEFYTTYGVSLLFDKVEQVDQLLLTSCLQTVADRYLDITLYALRDELRHFITGSDDTGEEVEDNLDLLAAKSIPTMFNSTVRASLDVDTIIELFDKGAWCDQYGGDAWADIGRACKDLLELMPVMPGKLSKLSPLLIG